MPGAPHAAAVAVGADAQRAAPRAGLQRGRAQDPGGDGCRPWGLAAPGRRPGEAAAVSLVPVPDAPARAVAEYVRDLYDTASHWVSDVRQLELAVALELALSLPLDPAGHDPAQHDELVDLRGPRRRRAPRCTGSVPTSCPTPRAGSGT